MMLAAAGLSKKAKHNTAQNSTRGPAFPPPPAAGESPGESPGTSPALSSLHLSSLSAAGPSPPSARPAELPKLKEKEEGVKKYRPRRGLADMPPSTGKKK